MTESAALADRLEIELAAVPAATLDIESDRCRDQRGDPVLVAVERYWGTRARLLRLLQRWDGWAYACELADTLDIERDSKERNSVVVELRRMVAAGLVIRRPFVSYAALQFYESGAEGAKYEYRAA